jgi:DNA-binding CsgD family transcriptional regulator
MVRPASRPRGLDDLGRLAGAGLDIDKFRAASLQSLRRILTIDAAFYATVDDDTMVMTSALSEAPLFDVATRFLDNEYGVADVNKFTEVADLTVGVASLDQSTHGDRWSSPRYREVMEPIGLGDEVRVALRSRGRCWGVLCLHREDGAIGFGRDEVDFLGTVGPILGEGLRHAVAVTSVTTGRPMPAGPGVLILDADLGVLSSNPQAARWLEVVDDQDWPPSMPLPVAVMSAAAAVRSSAIDAAAQRTRVRRRLGGWMTVQASPLSGSLGSTVVVLDAPETDELTSLALAAHGLTPAQSRVTTLVLRGRSTQQIMNELAISANTVQEHLSAVFDKLGVRNRRELVAVLMGQGTP